MNAGAIVTIIIPHGIPLIPEYRHLRNQACNQGSLKGSCIFLRKDVCRLTIDVFMYITGLNTRVRVHTMMGTRLQLRSALAAMHISSASKGKSYASFETPRLRAYFYPATLTAALRMSHSPSFDNIVLTGLCYTCDSCGHHFLRQTQLY